MAEKQNLEMYRGDSKTITVNFGANASMLVGGEVWMTIKVSKNSIPCDQPLNSLATVNIDSVGILGDVTGVTLVVGGYGYSATQDIVVSGGNGDCTLNITVVDRVITGVTIATAGTGYTPTGPVALTAPALPELIHGCVFQTNDTIIPVMDGATVIGYTAQIFIPPAISEQFEITSYVFDIQAVGPTEDPNHLGHPLLVKTLVEGKFKVVEDVTLKVA